MIPVVEIVSRNFIKVVQLSLCKSELIVGDIRQAQLCLALLGVALTNSILLLLLISAYLLCLWSNFDEFGQILL